MIDIFSWLVAPFLFDVFRWTLMVYVSRQLSDTMIIMFLPMIVHRENFNVKELTFYSIAFGLLAVMISLKNDMPLNLFNVVYVFAATSIAIVLGVKLQWRFPLTKLLR